MTLRERVIVFLMAAVALASLINALLLDPQYAKQKKLSQRIKQDQARVIELQQLIEQKVRTNSIDPDAANRARLQEMRQQYAKAQSGLMDMQKGLISPDKMTSVLENLLKRNGQLRLTSMKTLPVTGLTDFVADAPKTEPEKPKMAPIVAAAMDAATPPSAKAPNVKNENAAAKEKTDAVQIDGGIYKHGVEITVQGSYLDILDYMTQLEGLPWQLFWGKAKLTVDEYPKATLTLTLFTLSLDRKWLNL
jgi:MSHA biogenesis protein MshJ